MSTDILYIQQLLLYITSSRQKTDGCPDDILLNNAGYNAGTNGSAAFTNCEAQSLLDCDGRDQRDLHANVIAGHYHLYAFRQLDYTGYVGRSEVELRTIAIEERCMSATLFLGQYVYLGIEVRMRMN